MILKGGFSTKHLVLRLLTVDRHLSTAVELSDKIMYASAPLL